MTGASPVDLSWAKARKGNTMFIRNDIHRNELGDHFWDAACDFSGMYLMLFLKGALP
jgi:hypothetical protein